MSKHGLILALLMSVASYAAGADDGIHITNGRSQSLNWQVSDGAGYTWDISQYGAVSNGTNNAYSGGMRLLISGSQWSYSGTGMLRADGREIEIGPWTSGSLRVWRRIYVDPEIGYCRWIDIYENTESTEQNVPLQYHSCLGRSVRSVYTTAGGSSVTDKDWGVVTTYATQDSPYPDVVHIYASKDSKLKPRFQWTANNNNVYYQMIVKVPAKGAVAVCLFEAQRRPYSQAQKLVKEFRVDKELRKVPGPLRQIIVNMGGPAMVLGTLELPRNDQHDLVTKSNGDELLGAIQNARYVLEATSIGRLELPAERVVGFSVPEPESGYVQIGLADGQVVAGKLLSGPIKLKKSDGNEVSLALDAIRTAAYKVSSDRPAQIGVNEPMVVLRGGQRVFFSDEGVELAFHTEYGNLKLKCSDLAAVYFDSPEGGLHRAVFSNGSVLSGLLSAEELKLQLELQKTLTARTSAVERISFAPRQGEAGPLAELKLRNDDVLLGRLADESLSVETSEGKESKDPGDIAEIVFQPDVSPLAVTISLHDGSKSKGRLTSETIRFQIAPGPVVPVFVGHIVKITCPKGSMLKKSTTQPATQPTTKPAADAEKTLSPEAGAEAAKINAQIEALKAQLADLEKQRAELANKTAGSGTQSRLKRLRTMAGIIERQIVELEANLKEIK